ncbi:hypothetical protein [Nocardioides marmorisolisilvae]|uniref:SipW-cognate class signal peptide n=1 Tax=Nocardioides marmorisolisilvae TaxID=1542737 RepID=A0A3N0DX41_9ACTN|nr:hypothetical protein [Nocardioides marmorisolisilvae]RNL80188.1 hypothetical protein EFL95_14925 [Nocardioides marmorisolisilvae]
MNSKLVKGALAGVACITLAAGGATYAAWSDFGSVTGNVAGAGHLVLNVNQGTQTAESMTLAPGQGQSKDFYIASNDGQSVPNGELYITLKNLVNHEDGCTSNSEAAAENGGNEAIITAPGYSPSTSCGDNAAGNNNGELGSEARIEIIQYGPSSTGQCSSVAPLAGIPNSVVQNFTYVNTFANTKIPVVALAPGQATCVRAVVQLLSTADNKVQGDSITWDFRFDLEQI